MPGKENTINFNNGDLHLAPSKEPSEVVFLKDPSCDKPHSAITEHKKGGMGQLPATAICGNDITSSCLYVSALAIIYAGKWAPLVLLLVAGVLFLYRSIYAEVVGALPLNGGAYNALLNTTSKYRASSIAACLTILSYMATAVISASEAMHYVHTVWVALPVMSATIGLLAVFMVLTIIGIEFVAYLGTFGPDLIRELSKKWEIPTNLMFIGSPGNHFIYGLKDLGGVRLII